MFDLAGRVKNTFDGLREKLWELDPAAEQETVLGAGVVLVQGAVPSSPPTSPTSTTPMTPTVVVQAGLGGGGVDSGGSGTCSVSCSDKVKLRLTRGPFVSHADHCLFDGEFSYEIFFGRSSHERCKIKFSKNTESLSREYKILKYLHDKRPGLSVKPLAFLTAEEVDAASFPLDRSVFQWCIVMELGIKNLLDHILLSVQMKDFNNQRHIAFQLIKSVMACIYLAAIQN